MELELIQEDDLNNFIGDTCPIKIFFDADTLALIQECYIVSSELEINELMTKDEDNLCFTYKILPEVTKTFKAKTYTFDIEAHLDDETIVSQSPCIVKFKARKNPRPEV